MFISSLDRGLLRCGMTASLWSRFPAHKKSDRGLARERGANGSRKRAHAGIAFRAQAMALPTPLACFHGLPYKFAGLSVGRSEYGAALNGNKDAVSEVSPKDRYRVDRARRPHQA